MYRQNDPQLGSPVSDHPPARAHVLGLLGRAAACLALGIAIAAIMSDGFAPHNLRSFSGASEQWAVSLSVGGLFGAVTLVDGTLRHGARSIAYAEIASVRIEVRALTVWKRGAKFAWMRVPVIEIPNVEIAVRLLAAHVRVS